MGKKKVTSVQLLLMFCVFLIGACGDKDDPIQRPGEVPDFMGTVTFDVDIAPVLEDRCLRCHSIESQGAGRNGAPINVNFDTFQDAVMWSDLMNQRIQSGTMPPDGGIPNEERALFQQWIDDGLLEF